MDKILLTKINIFSKAFHFDKYGRDQQKEADYYQNDHQWKHPPEPFIIRDFRNVKDSEKNLSLIHI